MGIYRGGGFEWEKHGMENGVKASIVVTTYYRPRVLEKVLSSIAMLRYPKSLLEVLVVADPGDAEAREIVERFRSTTGISTRLLECPVNSASACRNYGIRNASGELVAIVDDDVALHPDTLAKALEHLAENSRVLCVGFPALSQNPSLPEKLHHGRLLGIVAGNIYTVFPVTVCWRRKMLENNLLYREDMGPPISIHEDWELGSRIRRRGYRIIVDGRITQSHLLHMRGGEPSPQGGGAGRLAGIRRYVSSYTARNWWTFIQVMKTSPLAQRLEFAFYFANPLIMLLLLAVNPAWLAAYTLLLVASIEAHSFTRRYWSQYPLASRAYYPLLLFTIRTLRTYLSILGLVLDRLRRNPSRGNSSGRA